MEQKNFILAIVLSLGFILLWSVFVVPKFAPPPAPVTAATPSFIGSGDSTVPSTTGPTATSPSEPLRTVVLQNADNALTLDPRGGSIQKWILDTKLQTLDVVAHPEDLPLASFPNTLFKISVRGGSAIMDATLPGGVRVTKTLTLAATGHLHRIDYHFVNPSTHPVDLPKWGWGWGPGLGTVASELKENAAQTPP